MKEKTKKIAKEFTNLTNKEIVEIYNRFCDLVGSRDFKFYKNTPESVKKILKEKHWETKDIFHRIVAYNPDDEYVFVGGKQEIVSTNNPLLFIDKNTLAKHIASNFDKYADIFGSIVADKYDLDFDIEKIKIKLCHELAKVPQRATEGSAGYDLFAAAVEEKEKYIEYDTGVAFEIPSGYVGLACARSSVTNIDLFLKNGVGIIDSDYRGTVKFRFSKLGNEVYSVGDKIGQILFVPCYCPGLKVVDKLSDTNRGCGGFGSTENK
jgi:dUTP pyrophosphatase